MVRLMTKTAVRLIGFLCILGCSFNLQSKAESVSEVQKICSGSAVEIIRLNRDSYLENLAVIKRKSIGTSKIAKTLSKWYSTKPKGNISVDEVNKNFNALLPDSKLKSTFINYSTKSSRIKNEDAFLNELKTQYDNLLGTEFGALKDFLSSSDNRISSNKIELIKNVTAYGATFSPEVGPSGKFNRTLKVSPEESESFPYLLTLIAHELVHAKYFYKESQLKDESFYKSRLLEEAEGYTVQLKAYYALAKKDKIFCDFIYGSFAFQEIPVPLSWYMDLVEREMKNLEMLKWYARDFQEKGYGEFLEMNGEFSKSFQSKINDVIKSAKK